MGPSSWVWPLARTAANSPRLVDRHLAVGELTVLYGKGDTYKSFVALDWACELARHGHTVIYVVAFLGWFAALVLGRMPKGLRDLGAYCLRYQTQTYAYLMLLTQRYPSLAGGTSGVPRTDLSPAFGEDVDGAAMG